MGSILEEAAEVVKDRKAAYDERERSFSRIATIWSVVFGHEVTPEQVAMCMIGLKLAREVYKPSRDSLVDICGYADCLADLRGYYGKKERGADPERAGAGDEVQRKDFKAGQGGTVKGDGLGYEIQYASGTYPV